MDYLLWATVVLIIALALAVLELFLPSGGVLGFLAVASLLGSIVLAFQHGEWYGFGFLTTAIFGVPVLVMLGLKYWPKTPIGRRVMLTVPTAEEVLPDDEQRRLLKSLVGKTGRSRSLMLPSGAVEIDGRTIDAVSEGMAIETGQWVRVVEVRGTRVVVRPVDEAELPRPSSDDALSRPIEEMGLDPFDDPLA